MIAVQIFFPTSLLTEVYDNVMSTMKSVGRLPVFLMSTRSKRLAGQS